MLVMFQQSWRRGWRWTVVVVGVAVGAPTVAVAKTARPHARTVVRAVKTTASPTATPSPTASVSPTGSPTATPTPSSSATASAGAAGAVLPQPSPTPTAIPPAAVNDAAVRDVVGRRAPRHAILRAQILLDRARFSPGEIDATYGRNMRHAITAFQLAREIPPTGEVDDATWTALDADAAPALVPYVITARDVAGPFTPVPTSMMEKAKLEALNYGSLQEELGERFHVSPELLAELNWERSMANPGDEIMVPNVAAAPPVEAREVVVSAGDRSVTVIAADGSVYARYPATTGSSHDPLPLGTWQINGVTRGPKFHYNPRLFWDANATDRAATIAPGPNNPVGVVWIDLSKTHYGIHGTPEPSMIGHTQSHGCIRLTNWSAGELSHMVKPGTPAILRE